MKKGSITVYMSLMLTLILSLLTASYTQARTAACRALLANAADLATFSLFAHYDKTLLENYDLFYFDASYQTGRFMPNSLCGYLREELTALLSPSESILSSGKNYLPCTVSGISLTSYTTATDLEGKIFLEPAFYPI